MEAVVTAGKTEAVVTAGGSRATKRLSPHAIHHKAVVTAGKTEAVVTAMLFLFHNQYQIL